VALVRDAVDAREVVGEVVVVDSEVGEGGGGEGAAGVVGLALVAWGVVVVVGFHFCGGSDRRSWTAEVLRDRGTLDVVVHINTCSSF